MIYEIFELGEASNQNENNGNEDENLPSGSNANQRRSLISRIRRLVSQSTLQEDELDNEINNYPQNDGELVDIEDNFNRNEDHEEEADEEHERLFEEYVRENQEASHSAQAPFDCEMPSLHSYLGETENVGGCSYFDAGKSYEIPVLSHHSLIFPGEIVPLIMITDRCLSRNEDGIVFGLNFENHLRDEKKTYGVICQVYEKGVDNHGHITVKSRAFQRYIVIERDGKAKEIKNGAYYSRVKILPEILLPEPNFLTISNQLRKHSQNTSSADKFKSFVAASSSWPKFVYDQYSVVTVSEKIERYLAMLSIESPQDPVLKTWWLARNVPLNPKDRMKIFKSNCVNKRLLMIGNSLNFMCYFLCKRCRTKIAIYNDIFAMAKGNVNANYCNPAGYIHETLTLNKTFETALRMVDKPSTEFSWFPGIKYKI